MNFLSKEYLPNSENRIGRLREIINGRRVAILTAGPSIKQLEDRIEELRHADICYFGLNRFIQEQYILGQIDKRLSVYMDSCGNNIPYTINDIIGFLNRDENNIFISSFWNDTFGLLDSSFDINQFVHYYNNKLISFSLGSGRRIPNKVQPLHFIGSNSLLVLIQMALIGKAASIVIFGADGGCLRINDEESHYRKNEYSQRDWSQISEYLTQDTKLFFNNIAPIAIKNTRKTYGLISINILNCSMKSFYSPFPKVSYDDALEYLLTGKKLIGKLDLRVPIEPKMPNIWFLAIEKIFNLWKKHRWNCFRIMIIKVWCKLINIPDKTLNCK